MSLDVYLNMPGVQSKPASNRILIRENGQNKEISREEWDERFPDREPYIVEEGDTSDCVFHYNITHNLSAMANAAGLYNVLWRPEEIGVTKAVQLIDPLSIGLHALQVSESDMKKLNPSNNWGDYEGLVQFVEHYLEACRSYPDADVRALR